MFDRFRLSQKSGMVIGTLLCFELVLLSFLNSSLNDAEQDLAKEGHARAIAMELSNLQSLLTRAASAQFLYQTTKDDFTRQEYDRLLSKLADKFRTLHMIFDLSDADRKELPSLDKIEQRTNEITRLSANDQQLSSLLVAKSEQAYMINACSRVMHDIDELSDKVSRPTTTVAQHTSSRRQLRAAVLFGAGLNILMAVLLATAFNRTVIKKLGLIEDNFQRLAKGEQLRDTLPGCDEFADVDRSFHKMATRLVELERVKRAFFAAISHDIRGPINSIYAALHLVLDKDFVEIPDKASSRLEKAARACTRIVDTVSQYLDFDKLDEGMVELDRKEVPLSDIVHDAIENLQGLFDQKELQISVQVDNVLLLVDKVWCTQILANYLSNAAKFSPPKSTIEITSSRERDFVQLAVSDNGPGIDEDDQKLVFERYVQTAGGKKAKQSSGLGLAICKIIAEKHGGAVGVTSTIGKGSVFWCKLPAANRSADPGHEQ